LNIGHKIYKWGTFEINITTVHKPGSSW